MYLLPFACIPGAYTIKHNKHTKHDKHKHFRTLTSIAGEMHPFPAPVPVCQSLRRGSGSS